MQGDNFCRGTRWLYDSQQMLLFFLLPISTFVESATVMSMPSGDLISLLLLLVLLCCSCCCSCLFPLQTKFVALFLSFFRSVMEQQCQLVVVVVVVVAAASIS